MNRSADTVQCVWDLRATLGESPIWCESNHAVWFVDIKQQRIHRFDTESQQGKSWDCPSQPGFIVQSDGDSFIVGLQYGLHRFEPATDTFTLIREVEPALATNRLNDGYIDPAGRLWFGSMDDREREPSGGLYRLDANGNLVCVERGICIVNGPCVSPDGRTFYRTDTVNRIIHAFELREDGSLSAKRVFACFDAWEGHPDGSIVDAEGCLWVALWGGWGLVRFAPDGARIDKVSLPCANVTKAAFGGRDLRTLYVMTARKGLSDDELAKQPLAGGLFALRLAEAGLPSHRIDLSGWGISR